MKRPYFPYYWGDWLRDSKVSKCAPATRGIWWDAISSMQESGSTGSISGTLEQLAQVCRCNVNQMREAVIDLAYTGAADVRLQESVESVSRSAKDSDPGDKVLAAADIALELNRGSNPLVTLTNRRQHREFQEREDVRLRVLRHRAREGLGSDNGNDVTEMKRQCNAALPVPSPIPITKKEEEGKSAKRARRSPEPRSSNGSPAFDEFWKAHPRKVDKPKAESAWRNQGCDPIAAEVMRGLVAWKASRKWTEDNGEFIPYPATWLNRRGWEEPVKAETASEDTSWLYTAEEYDDARKKLKR